MGRGEWMPGRGLKQEKARVTARAQTKGRTNTMSMPAALPPPQALDVKQCTACGETKPLSAFHATSKGRDGRRAACKPCRLQQEADRRARHGDRIRARQRDHYQRHREEMCERQRVHRRQNRAALRAYFREYRRRRPDVIRAGQRRWNAANPEKRRAHSALWNAIRRGVVRIATSCEDCRRRGYVEAHHDDYQKPLVVRWLCELCHVQADRARRLAGAA